MITGVINANTEAVVHLFIRGENAASGILHEIEAVIDSGFDECLSLPGDLIAALELPFVTEQQIMLANGAVETCFVHEVTVLWDGQDRRVPVQSAAGTPPIGMAMLHRHDMVMHIDAGGKVTITAFAA